MKGLITGPPKGGKRKNRIIKGGGISKNMSKVKELFDLTYQGKLLEVPDENGTPRDCRVLATFRTDRSKEQRYIALEKTECTEGEPTLMLFRYFEEEDGPTLETVVDMYEYEVAANVLTEYLNTMEAEAAKQASDDAGDCDCNFCG